MSPRPIGESHPAAGARSPVDAGSWSAADFPLGAHEADGGAAWTFAVYSGSAERVLLELYDQAMGQEASCDYWLAKGADGIWRAKIAGVRAGALYGFRCWGPNFVWDPAWQRGDSAAGFRADVDDEGNRFNPNKLLFDPYARELSSDRETPELVAAGHDGNMYLSGPRPYAGGGRPPVPSRNFDTGPWAPKAITVYAAGAGAAGSGRPAFPQEDSIIYEVHLRGLSKHPSSGALRSLLAGVAGFEDVEDVPEDERGTYPGAARMARYLKGLGYNVVELLPVHEFANAMNPDDVPDTVPPHGNYWGYMTYGFFAPDRQFARDRSPGGPTRELREMVDAFHAQGIKVYLDVVYNHTGEQGIAEDKYEDIAEIECFRGLDNRAYYALAGEGNRRYWASTGCGNNLDASSAPVRRLILDSLAYWSDEMGVDGFRFDLAAVLGRTGPDFDFETTAGLLADIAALAEDKGFDIVAEPWDVNARETGAFPPGWAEWNDGYRDRVRDFLRGMGDVRGFMDAVNGSYAEYHDQGGPQKSVNLVTAHDGFTLMDLVSYAHKNNDEQWPFGPSDGGESNNRSWDSGGDHALRRQRMRSFLTIQFFSRGIPLTVGGDELARTQNGNNNPYKHDNAAMWINYSMVRTHAPDRVAILDGMEARYHDNYGLETTEGEVNGLFRFVQHLTALRRGHVCLRQKRYADLELDRGGDVTYLFKREDGRSDLEGYERCVHLHIDGSEVGDHDFLVLIDMFDQDVRFQLPAPAPGREWRRLIDTAAWAERTGNFWTAAAAERIDGDYLVHAWSVVVLEEMPAP